MPERQRRFVVLHHRTRDGEHWDLMLETGDALATWQLGAPPDTLGTPGASVPARRISDHRLAYLEYEGPISGDRGEVVRVDAGTWRLLEAGEQWRFECAGNILRGCFEVDAARAGHLMRVA